MIRFMLGVLLGWLIWAYDCKADPYFLAGIGQSTFTYQHEYIQEADRGSSTKVFGLGYSFSDNLAIEGTVRDFGTYHFVLEKPVHIYRHLYLDIPGYVNLDLSGIGLQLRFNSGGFFFKPGVVSLNAEARLITPFGYRLYEERVSVPVIELGYATGSAEMVGTWLPYLRGFGIAARFEF